MHCPRCGQHQISEETKFCSRCGLQLGLVAELLANGGFLPQLADLYKGKSTIFTRKNGILLSVFWCIVFMMLLPSLFGIAGADGAAGVSAVFGVFTSMMILIASLAFLKKAPTPLEIMGHQPSNPVPTALPGHVQVNALPPQQSQPVSSYMPPEGSWKGPDTGEFAQPGSVTDGTTRLLKKDE